MLFSKVTKLSLLFIFLICEFAFAQTRMAAELEFDLKFFAENAPIRKYFDVTKSGAELMAEEFDILSNPDSVFIRKKSLDPAVSALLDRFEFAWETGFKPPKLEIRHRGTRSPIQVKSDIKAMLRLFASSDA